MTIMRGTVQVITTQDDCQDDFLEVPRVICSKYTFANWTENFCFAVNLFSSSSFVCRATLQAVVIPAIMTLKRLKALLDVCTCC